METLIIQSTDKTPEVKVDYNKSEISIIGRAMAESCLDMFSGIVDRIKENQANMPNSLSLFIQLDYCNSQCTKGLFKLMGFLNESRSFEMKVIWRYEEDDDFTLDLGQELEKLVGEPFDFQKI